MVPKRYKKSFAFFIICVLAVFLFAGCSSQSSSGSKKKSGSDSSDKSAENTKPQTGGTITVGTADEPDTLDVHKTSMNVASQIASHLGGTLLTINPDNNELGPYLAESYDVSQDGKTITFKIRQGIKFTDGTPVTAKVFKETFDRILDPKTGATVVANFLAGVKSTSAPDDQTFVIELTAPSAPFLRNLAADGYMQPLSMAAIEKSGDSYGRTPVGAGPWKFKEWVTGQSVTLERNDDFNWPQNFYENKEKAYADKLVYKFIPDAQTMLAALDSGSIDIAMLVSAKDVQRYRNNPKFEVVEEDRQGLGLFLEMNLEKEALADLNVRKAINMALNKDAIIKSVVNGEGTPSYGPIPATIFGYDPEVESYGYKYNSEKAIKELEKSGYKKNSKGIMEKDGKQLKFVLTTMDKNNQAAQIVQAMLKDIGIDISIQSMEPGTMIDKVSKGEFDLSFLGYTYNDPDILYLLFHSSQVGGLNHDRVKNPELDALLEKGRAALDDNERKQVYAEAQKIIVQEAYWAPLYTEKVFYVVNKRVHNAKIFNGLLLLHDSWVDQ